VEDYIEGNWDQPLSIDALSVIVGVSARSLFQYPDGTWKKVDTPAPSR